MSLPLVAVSTKPTPLGTVPSTPRLGERRFPRVRRPSAQWQRRALTEAARSRIAPKRIHECLSRAETAPTYPFCGCWQQGIVEAGAKSGRDEAARPADTTSLPPLLRGPPSMHATSEGRRPLRRRRKHHEGDAKHAMQYKGPTEPLRHHKFEGRTRAGADVLTACPIVARERHWVGRRSSASKTKTAGSYCFVLVVAPRSPPSSLLGWRCPCDGRTRSKPFPRMQAAPDRGLDWAEEEG